MSGPFPVEPRRPAPRGTRTLVLRVVRATGDAAASGRHPRTAADGPALERWSPYRLPGGFTRRVVGRFDRLLVERAGGLRAAAGSLADRTRRP